jgi:ATP-binding cassette subfamily B protein
MFRYLTMLIWPLMGAGFMVNMIQRGAVSLGRINEILNTVPSIMDIGDKDIEKTSMDYDEVSASGINSIDVRSLSFSYNGKDKVLDDINFSIKRGEWLGIMGKTGSGKTTLIKTFTRMLDPPPGSMRIYGLDIHDWPLENLRKLFAVSPQDSYLFSDSIANNISYAYDGENAKAVDNAIKFAALEKDLNLFKHGKETLVGERGLTLSGGQKQRATIARAAIMDAEFLILDDSLSAVDNETERKILEMLLKDRKGKTTIIVSHRVSTIKYADNVLVLDKGKVCEYGSPAQLAGGTGFYARMAAFQRLDTWGQNV